MFNPEQIKQLEAPLSRAHVRERTQAGRQLSYIEAWWAISEANRIFGFDGWDRETVDLRQLGPEREVDGKWRVAYMAKVRIRVGDVIREGCGYGSGIDRDLGSAHESALKEAESDAMKRALMTFGNPFGLALYDKTQENVENAPPRPQEARGGPQQAPGVYGVLNGVKRLTGAQAKERGIHTKIDDAIALCKTHDELAAWDKDFDRHTAECPLSWLDAIRNKVILRGEEITAELSHQEMDREFAAVVG